MPPRNREALKIFDLVNNGLLGLRIEEVNMSGIKGNLDLVTGTGGGTSGYAGGEVLTFGNEVQEGFGTESLNNINLSFYEAIRHLREVHRLIMDMLRTDTNDDILAVVSKNSGITTLGFGELDGGLADVQIGALAVYANLGIDGVHLRSTDEGCNKLVAGVFIQLLRSSNLLNETVTHNNDTGSHGHSFGLVVGNIDEGGLEFLMQTGQVGSHLGTQLSIQVGQRLVQKEDLRITDDGTAQSNTLSLTTGQSGRLSLKQMRNAEDLSGSGNTVLDLSLGHMTDLQTESHIIKNSHVRIQSVVLEHHGNVTILGRNVIDQTVINIKFTVGNFFQTGDHTQSGGLTAAGRTDQNDKFLIFDIEGKIGNRNDTGSIALINVGEL